MLTPEQKKRRMSGIGGSDVAACLGLSKWKTQLQLWGEKTGKIIDDQEENEAMHWGTVMEDLIAARFLHFNDVPLQRSVEFSHHKYPMLIANLDGLITDGDDRIVWEAKTAQNEWSGDVPIEYQLQVQHYMYVTDADSAIISVLFHGNYYQEIPVRRDPNYATKVVPRLLSFWNSVQSGIPQFAAATMEDIGILIKLKPEEGGTLEVHSDNMVFKLAKKIWTEQAEVSMLEESVKRDKVTLSEWMVEHDTKTVMYNGKSIATLVTTKDHLTFNTETFKMDNPTLFNAYNDKVRKGYTSLRITAGK